MRAAVRRRPDRARPRQGARGPAVEEKLGGTRDIAILKGLWRYIRPYRGLFWVSTLLLPAISGFMLLQPYVVKRSIDPVDTSRRQMSPAAE